MKPKDYILEQIFHNATNPVPAELRIDPGFETELDKAVQKNWRQKIPQFIKITMPLDASLDIMIDDVHSRDAFGSTWQHNCRPFHLKTPAMDVPSFKDYQFPTVQQFYNEKLFQDSLNFCQTNKNSFVLAYMGWGLFERTWTIRGFENALSDIISQPVFYEELLDRILDLQMAMLEKALTLPVDGIMFSDDWGDQRGVIVGPPRWRTLFKPRLAKLYQRVRQAGKIAVSHCCGNVADIMPDIIDIGLDVLESVQPEAMNPYDLKRKWGPHITFWGGLGSQSLLQFGTPSDIKCETERLCSEMGRGGGYILAPAKALQPGMPIENALTVLDVFARLTMETIV
jgi:uroporphyrinogen decarboxylase